MKKVLLILIAIYLNLLSLDAVVVQGELTKVFNLAHGETATEYINIHNPENKQLQVKITQADYLYNAADENWYLEAGKFNRSNANWISVSQNISLNVYESISLPVHISIPNDNKLIGSYWSVIFIENSEPPSTEHLEQQTENILFAYRYAIQIVSNIKETGTIDIGFKNFAVGTINQTTQNIVYFDLKNNGTQWINASLKIDIFDNNTNFIGTFYANNQRVYPGLEKRISIPLIPLKSTDKGVPVTYYAILVADCGNNKIFGHQFSFSIK